MANEGPRTEVPATLSVRVTLQDIYDRLCPVCRERLIEVLTGQADKTAIHEALKRQLEAKSDGS